MRAWIYTLGCRLNQAESQLLEDRLVAAGFEMVRNGKDPVDLIIINTCTVTGEADTKSRKMIRAAVRNHPDASVVVTGCYAERQGDMIADIPGVDLVVGTADKLDIPALLGHLDAIAERRVHSGLTAESFRLQTQRTAVITRRAHLKIQDGCNCRCSYCIVPLVRGPSRSRAMDDILVEAKQLVACGAREIVLTGINTGDYAWEGRTLCDVLDALAAIPGKKRLRFGSLEMSAVPDGILERMADPAHPLTPFLHVPLQSGSPRIARLMNRAKDGNDFRALTRRAVELVPDIGIGTDILVGFPGETDADFEETLALLRDTPTAYAHVFKYSPRPDTPAATMPDRVPPEVADVRAKAVRDLSLAKRRAFNARFLGSEVEVLFESRVRGQWEGYAPNYMLVRVPCEANLSNEFRQVRLDVLDDSEGVLGI